MIALALLGVLLALLFAMRSPAAEGATVDELAAARAIASIRLRHYEAERAERMRRYAEAWRVPKQEPGRGYVIPFAAGGR